MKPKRPNNPSAKYWMALELPSALSGLSMTQLTAVRIMVRDAFTAGRKLERSINEPLINGGNTL